MTKYNQAFKEQVIEFYVEHNENLSKTLEHFLLPRPTVSRWIAQFRYSGSNGLAVLGTRRDYSTEFKLKVIQSILDDELTAEQATLYFGIANSGTISHWLKVFKEQGITGLLPKPKGRPSMKPNYAKMPPTPKTEEERLRLKILALEAEVAYLKKLDEIVKRDQATRRKRSKR